MPPAAGATSPGSPCGADVAPDARGPPPAGQPWPPAEPPVPSPSLEVRDPVAQEGGAGIAGLLRVELRRRKGAVLDGCHESVAAVLGPGHRRRRQAPVGRQRPRAGGVGVHEIEPLPLEPREQPRPRRDGHRVPPHVRQDRRLELLDDARPLAEPLGPHPVLDALVEEDLHPDTDAEYGPTAGEPTSDERRSADPAQPGHARSERTDAGDDEPVSLGGDIRVGRQGDRRAHAFQSAYGRPEVAGPVVEDDHRRLGHLQRALGRRHALHARVESDGVTQGASDRLELGLDDVVRVAPAQNPDVQTDLGRCADRLPDVPGQRGVVGADELDDLGLDVDDVRPAGKVDRRLAQRLVQRHERVAEATDPGLVPQRLAQRLAERK